MRAQQVERRASHPHGGEGISMETPGIALDQAWEVRFQLRFERVERIGARSPLEVVGEQRTRRIA